MEFDLLSCLMQAPGRVFARAELLDTLGATAMVERTVHVHVRHLRAKIERDPRQPPRSETVCRVGYRLSGGGPTHDVRGGTA